MSTIDFAVIKPKDCSEKICLVKKKKNHKKKSQKKSQKKPNTKTKPNQNKPKPPKPKKKTSSIQTAENFRKSKKEEILGDDCAEILLAWCLIFVSQAIENR